MEQPAGYAGIFLARVWLEGERGERFRARMRFIDDVTAEQQVATVARREEFLKVVEDWLERFLERGEQAARSETDSSAGPPAPRPAAAPESN